MSLLYTIITSSEDQFLIPRFNSG